MPFEQVDRLIKALAEDIIKKTDVTGEDYEREIEGKTKALAELVSARANMN